MKLPRKVYAIQHNVTGKLYIGSSKDVENRYKSHIYALRSGRHSVEDMQDDYDEYGEDYSVFILDEITSYSERGREYEWMREYKSYEPGLGYNYKDRERAISRNVTFVPFKEGLPEAIAQKDEDYEN